MGLVDYDSDASSDAGSDAEAPPKTLAKAEMAAPTSATGKKPFRKLVDRANPGKIVVNLPSVATGSGDGGDDDAGPDGPPAKRARLGPHTAAPASRFGGLRSFLPAPKKTGASASSPASEAGPSAAGTGPGRLAPRPGVHLKTSGEAAFSRGRGAGDGRDDSEQAEKTDDQGARKPQGAGLVLPLPKTPSVPADQKAAADVKLVGNPLLFMPLSVSRRPGKKAKGKGAGGASSSSTASAVPAATPASAAPTPAPAPPPKISLFSLESDNDTPADETPQDSVYQPLFHDTYSSTGAGTGENGEAGDEGDDYATFAQQAPPAVPPSAPSLDALADELQLSAKQRRELFGRGGSAAAAAAASAVVETTFDMDREYRQNELLRQAGELAKQQANPVRAVMPGKHSLRQLVNAVHGQQEALEESFAKNRAAQRDAGSKYGWR